MYMTYSAELAKLACRIDVDARIFTYPRVYYQMEMMDNMFESFVIH